MKDKAFLSRMQLQGKIGNWTDMGNGHVRGYAGLVNTALAISEYIPKSKLYVEPFAGLGRVAKFIKTDMMVLNDKSDYAFNFLKKHFNGTIIQEDFQEVFRRYNTKDVVWLIDPPWSETEYKDGCRNRAFIDRSVKQYYDDIFDWLPSLLGQWFLCGKKDNKRLLDPKYHNHLFKSKKKIMGGNISTLVMSNKSFIRCNQESLIPMTLERD